MSSSRTGTARICCGATTHRKFWGKFSGKVWAALVVSEEGGDGVMAASLAKAGGIGHLCLSRGLSILKRTSFRVPPSGVWRAIMDHTKIDMDQFGTARDGFITRAEDWPPNVKAADEKPSPSSAHLGLELLAVDRDRGVVEMAFQASEALCNKWGGIQGGNVAAMLDDAMAFAIGLNLDWGQISPTLELKVSMMAPARPGRLYAVGRVVRRGRSVGFVEGELYNDEGQLLAAGSSTANFVTLKKR